MSALFVPPESDEIINRAGREKIPVYLFIDPDEPSIIYIKTKDNIEIIDNSIYELNIPEINFSDGDYVNKYKYTFLTNPSPAYVTIEDVLSLCRNLPIDKKDVLYHIREASKVADYWAYHDSEFNEEASGFKKLYDVGNIKDEYYPFYMFVKYTAVVNCIKSFYIKAVSQPYKFKDALSDLEREEEMDLNAIKSLLDKLEAEADDWLDLVITITADPQWALRGKYSYAVISQNYRPYHPTLIDRQGWSRGY